MVKKNDKPLEDKPASQKEKQALLERRMASINKKAGREVIQIASEARSRERIPFSSKELNDITGGGIPMGAFSVLWGGKACGKTSSAYDIIAQAQKMGKICVHYDFERSFDPKWAERFGVNLKFLSKGKFENAEEGLDNVIDLCREKLVDVIVIDSIQGLCPQSEYETKGGQEKSLSEDTMGLLPRRLSKFFSKAAPFVDTSNCAIVMIGQTRMDLGGFIKLESLTGGNALQHWSSLTIQMRRGKKDNAPYIWLDGEEKGDKREKKLTGFELVAVVNKSKVGPDEGKEARIQFYYGNGFTTKEEDSEKVS